MGCERLVKLLAASGTVSRRGAAELIRAGRVAVDGKVVTHPGAEVDPDACITVDGRPLPRRQLQYLLYHKPRGVVTTRADPHARPTLSDVLGTVVHGLYPVGRLDRDSEGLLLLTNDGETTLVLTHPRYQVEKIYRVWTARSPGRHQLARARAGVRLEDGWVRPQRVRPVETAAGPAVEVVITEGRKRELRRLFAALGLPVTRLLRVQMGPLRLGRLQAGEWRELTSGEAEELQNWVAARRSRTGEERRRETP